MNTDPQDALVIGLGGNLGGTDEVLRRFTDVSHRLSVLWGAARTSRCYGSAPIGPVHDQPTFVNAVVAYWPKTMPTPEDALALLHALEREHSRVRTESGGPRTLDLDLLLHAGTTRDHPGLRIPHARMHERAFVLRPLQELFGPDFQWDPAVPSVGALLSQPDVAEQECAVLEHHWSAS